MSPNYLAVAAATVFFAKTALATSLVTLSLEPGMCWWGCYIGMEDLVFGDVNETELYYAGLAGSTYYMTSTVLCMDTYCTAQAEANGWETFTSYALEYGYIQLPAIDVVRAQINQSQVVSVDALNATNQAEIWNSTVLIIQSNYEAGLRTETVWDQEMNHHHAFGWSLYILVGAMVLVGIGNRIFAYFVTRLYTGDAEDAYMAALPHDNSLSSKIYTLYRRHISTPAMFGYRHLQPWGGMSIPTRIQSIFIFAYVLVNVVFSCAYYKLFDENLYWFNDKPDQLARYIADRTGIMCFYNLPLVWALAGRNDILIYLTGWSFQSMNLFHRWAARMAVLQAIAHSACWTWIEKGYLGEMWAYQYWATGIFATVCMCMLLPFSVRPLREHLYEFFLLVHIGLALITLVMLFLHVKIFDGDYNPWLWVCVGLWSADRLLRIVRFVLLSFKTFRAGGSNTVAQMTGGESGLIRLSVQASISLNPSPGSYYFLYTPRSFTPWENHPFTLASWEQNPNGGTILHFLMSPQGGATRRIQRRIAQVQSGKIDMRVFLEGPYGHVHPVTAYEHILLIAGGSGVTAILPYIFALREGKLAHVRRITVVWIVKNAQYAADVLSNELCPKNTQNVSLEVFVTREEGAQAGDVIDALPEDVSAAVESSESEKSIDNTKNDHDATSTSGPRIVSGRPEMRHLVARSLDKLVGSERLAVLACGPWGMMDDLRQAISLSYGSGEGQVRGSALEYFEEAFSW